MYTPQAPRVVDAWLFSELCNGCGSLVTGAFCNDEFCRRRFVLAGDRTRLYCPAHDPAVSPDRVRQTMKGVVRCPACQRNLYGVKEEDFS